MKNALRKLRDFVGCAATLGRGPFAKAAILWRETKNLRVGLKLGRYRPDQVYSLQTTFGRLYFRDNFGDITNLLNLLYHQVYRVRQLPQEGVILDVGANIGLAAVWFAHFNPGRPIHCFEPLASNAEMIRRNCPQAVVENIALGAERGQVRLGVDADQVMASRIPCRWQTGETSFEMMSLDEYAAARELGPVALLKIDAEGMEADILLGARRTLERTHQVILETHGQATHADVVRQLEEAGLDIDDASFNGRTGMVFASRASWPVGSPIPSTNGKGATGATGWPPVQSSASERTKGGGQPVPNPLSVVVIVLGGPGNLARCLEALCSRQTQTPLEVIVPVDERHWELLQLADQYSSVRFLSVSGRRTFAELRSFGCRAAAGEIIALTEDHCIPAPDWCEQIVRAHAASHAVVGGAVEKRPGDTALNWGLYLCDYGRYMNPIPEGPAHSATDCNVSYKRKALEAIAPTWAVEFHENLVHGELQARGERLWCSPRVVVEQQRSVSLGAALWDRYAFGRLFGSTRAGNLSPGRRLLAAVAPLLPALLIARVAGHVVRARRHGWQFLRALPALVALTTAWALGECLGYLTARSPIAPVTKSHQNAIRTEAVLHSEG